MNPNCAVGIKFVSNQLYVAIQPDQMPTVTYKAVKY